jgi:hypothetical protein
MGFSNKSRLVEPAVLLTVYCIRDVNSFHLRDWFSSDRPNQFTYMIKILFTYIPTMLHITILVEIVKPYICFGSAWALE